MSNRTPDRNRIQILVEGEHDESALGGLLPESYDIVPEDAIRPASCYLVGDRSLPRHREALRRRKQSEQPVFCPVLLVKRPDSQLDVRLARPDEDGEQNLFDDVVTAPVDEHVLQRRVENLCIRREQSIALADQYEQMEERYEQLFEAANDAVFVVDAESNEITDCNAAAGELLGYSRFRLPEFSPSLFFRLGDDDDFESFLQRVVQADSGRTESFVCKSKWGQRCDVAVSATSVENESGLSVLMFVRDVSDRKRRETQIQALNRVLRHNIRNSMNVIHGYADLIGDSTTEDTVEGFADEITAKSSALVDLSEKSRAINDALQTAEEHYLVDVVEIVWNVRETLSEEYPAAEFTITAPDDAYTLGNGYLGDALRELCENAIVHSDEAEPPVNISVVNGRDEVTVQIEDRGTGISEQELAILEREETALRHGSGLGLLLVNSIVTALGGTLDISVAEPFGSVATVSLPKPPEQRRDP